MSKEKKTNIEDGFNKLDKIIDKMNKDTCPIEENIKLYEEGSKILSDMKKSIDKIEAKIETLGGR